MEGGLLGELHGGAGTGIGKMGRIHILLGSGDPASGGQHLKDTDLGAKEEQRLQKKKWSQSSSFTQSTPPLQLHFFLLFYG